MYLILEEDRRKYRIKGHGESNPGPLDLIVLGGF